MAIDPRNNDIIGIGVLHIKNDRACTIIVGVCGVQSDLCTQ